MIRLAEIKASNVCEDEKPVKRENHVTRMKKLEKLCEENGIPKPSEETAKQDMTQMFISLLNQSQNPYLEYKKSDSIRRALLRRNFIKLPKTKNQILAQKIVRRINAGKTERLIETDSSIYEPTDEEILA